MSWSRVSCRGKKLQQVQQQKGEAGVVSAAEGRNWSSVCSRGKKPEQKAGPQEAGTTLTSDSDVRPEVGVA